MRLKIAKQAEGKHYHLSLKWHPLVPLQERLREIFELTHKERTKTAWRTSKKSPKYLSGKKCRGARKGTKSGRHYLVVVAYHDLLSCFSAVRSIRIGAKESRPPAWAALTALTAWTAAAATLRTKTVFHISCHDKAKLKRKRIIATGLSTLSTVDYSK